MNVIRLYDTNEDVLVVRKSDYQNNNISMDILLSPKKNGFVKTMGLTVFIYSSPSLMETDSPCF